MHWTARPIWRLASASTFLWIVVVQATGRPSREVVHLNPSYLIAGSLAAGWLLTVGANAPTTRRLEIAAITSIVVTIAVVETQAPVKGVTASSPSLELAGLFYALALALAAALSARIVPFSPRAPRSPVLNLPGGGAYILLPIHEYESLRADDDKDRAGHEELHETLRRIAEKAVAWLGEKAIAVASGVVAVLTVGVNVVMAESGLGGVPLVGAIVLTVMVVGLLFVPMLARA